MMNMFVGISGTVALSVPAALAVGAVLSGLAFALLWVAQRRLRDAGIVDVGWAAAIGLMMLWLAVAADAPAPRRALVAVLAIGWSVRLTFHLYRRMRGRPEDGRYRELREKHGARANVYFFWFYQIQAASVVILALPALVAIHNPAPLASPWTLLAVALLIVSVSGEALADAQLERFKADPSSRGNTCRAGLWRYSRHPNYFFEWLHWWIYPLLSIGSPWWWISLLGPALMLYFLLGVTGIPATEAHAVASRRDYADYQRTTSAFFPWFPKESGPCGD